MKASVYGICMTHCLSILPRGIYNGKTYLCWEKYKVYVFWQVAFDTIFKGIS